MADPFPVSVPPLQFTEIDSILANREWKASCGPHAIAASCCLNLDQVHTAILHAEINYRGWMSPTQVTKTLTELGKAFRFTSGLKTMDLCDGVNRVQWEGKWLNSGVNPRFAYFHTHLVAHLAGWILCTGCISHEWIPVKDWLHFFLETEPREPFHITHHWRIE